MKFGLVKVNDIEIGERFRIDYGDLEELALSIREKELINPVTVSTNEGDDKYRLAAGGRRMAAIKLLGWEEIPCRIYDHPLSDIELRSIELEENLKRKDLTFMEECNLKRELLRIQQEIYGVKTSTAKDAPGVSLRDVADIIGVSPATFSQDVSLAEAIDMFPQMDWKKCKNKSDAMKLKNKIEETFLRKELAKRAEQEIGTSNSKIQKIQGSYIVGDFFEKIKEIPDGLFDLVEIDPPYAIDLKSAKKDYAYNHEQYNEVSLEEYPEFLDNLFKECYRTMSTNSWLICWFGIQWYQTIYDHLQSAGFSVNRVLAYWVKPTGQCQSPSTALASSVEPFFYAQKGTPILAKQGHANTFLYSGLAKKSHPTERPIEMIEDVLTTFGMENSRVLVPFAGSGNTLLAAFKHKMIPIGFDLTAEYRNSFILKINEMFK